MARLNCTEAEEEETISETMLQWADGGRIWELGSTCRPVLLTQLSLLASSSACMALLIARIVAEVPELRADEGETRELGSTCHPAVARHQRKQRQAWLKENQGG
jgi:hypothetical protein